MPAYISRISIKIIVLYCIYRHNQHELKISYTCDMLVVIIYGDLKMGGSYLFCFVILGLHASELIMFVVYCSQLMLDYFVISNMYVNHVIVVI